MWRSKCYHSVESEGERTHLNAIDFLWRAAKGTVVSFSHSNSSAFVSSLSFFLQNAFVLVSTNSTLIKLPVLARTVRQGDRIRLVRWFACCFSDFHCYYFISSFLSSCATKKKVFSNNLLNSLQSNSMFLRSVRIVSSTRPKVVWQTAWDWQRSPLPLPNPDRMFRPNPQSTMFACSAASDQKWRNNDLIIVDAHVEPDPIEYEAAGLA